MSEVFNKLLEHEYGYFIITLCVYIAGYSDVGFVIFLIHLFSLLYFLENVMCDVITERFLSAIDFCSELFSSPENL